MSTPKVVAKVALDSPEETSLLQLLKDEPEVVEVRTKYNLSDVTVRRFLRVSKCICPGVHLQTYLNPINTYALGSKA